MVFPHAPHVCIYLYNSGESVEHRIDAATREAEAGYTVCRGCEFENFKRFSYCSLCGEKLPSAGGDDGTSSNRSSAVTSDLAADGSTQLTSQQTRARYVHPYTRHMIPARSSFCGILFTFL